MRPRTQCNFRGSVVGAPGPGPRSQQSPLCHRPDLGLARAPGSLILQMHQVLGTPPSHHSGTASRCQVKAPLCPWHPGRPWYLQWGSWSNMRLLCKRTGFIHLQTRKVTLFPSLPLKEPEFLSNELAPCELVFSFHFSSGIESPQSSLFGFEDICF